MHWDYFADGRYSMIPDIFDVVTLSFRVGAMKPDPKIYAAAAEAAHVRPEEIFFMDDTAGHVAAHSPRAASTPFNTPIRPRSSLICGSVACGSTIERSQCRYV